MGIDKDRVKTQDETGELAAIDQVEDRVEAEMKKLEGEAKKFVADGMQNNKLAQEGERMVAEAERELAKENSE